MAYDLMWPGPGRGMDLCVDYELQVCDVDEYNSLFGESRESDAWIGMDG